MEYRTLENTSSVYIYEAFTQAFSDCQISVGMPFKSFEAMLKRNGSMPAVSVGAFTDRTLVDFILNGVRGWDNKKTVYDLGTGAIPGFRRTGIMGELLNLVSTICIKNKINMYRLKVIQDNEKALTLYEKQGFRINKILNCHQLTNKIKEPGIYKVWKLEHPEKLQNNQWTAVKDFWTYPPSWQDVRDAICTIANSFSYTIVKFDGNLIGYGAMGRIKGGIAQLAVHPQYRKMRVATEILLDLLKQTRSLEMRIVNVDGRDQTLNAFLKRLKFNVFAKQCEMRKHFSDQDIVWMERLTLGTVVSKGAVMRCNKIIILSNGMECCLRNEAESDGQLVVDNFNLTHSETDYLLTHPDEDNFSIEQESQFLKEKAEDEGGIKLLTMVDNIIAGTAGTEAIGTEYKVRHRVEFGISVVKKYWGLGIGKALLASCIGCAKTTGYNQLELKVVAENEKAVSMYERAEFVECGGNPKGFRSRIVEFREVISMGLGL